MMGLMVAAFAGPESAPADAFDGRLLDAVKGEVVEGKGPHGRGRQRGDNAVTATTTATISWR